MKRMALVFSYSPFPTHSGSRLRSRSLLHFLRNKVDLDWFSFVSNDQERTLVEQAGGCALPYRFRPVAGLSPNLAPFYNAELIDRLKPYSVIAFDQLFCACNALALEQPAYKILFEHNVESEILRQRAALENSPQKRLFWAQYMALRQNEEQIWPLFDLRCAVSQADLEPMQRRCPKGQLLLLPNGVDEMPAQPGALTQLLFVGAFDYWPNQDAARILVEEVMPQLPESSLRLIGRNPPEWLVQACQQQPRLELRANVENVAEAAQGCGLSVIPLRVGSGTRLKVLESAMWGLPLVATPLACEGLEFSAYRSATTAAEFRHAILDLQSHPEAAFQLGQQARAQVMSSYTWEQCWAPLEDFLASV